MLSDPIASLKELGKIVTATRESSVAEAAARMLAEGVGALVILEDGALVGIFTEHDIVSRVIAPGREPRAVHLGEVMTPEPFWVGPETSLGLALVEMHERGIRHLPVVDAGKPIGMVYAPDALDPDLEDFVSEVRRRESFR